MRAIILHYVSGRSMLLTLSGMLLALLAVIITAASVGPVTVPFSRTAAVLLEQIGIRVPVPYTEREWLIISEVRLPRVLVGALVGMALGISGAAMQGVFRNPLVEPGYAGVSSGAALGAVCALFFGWTRFGNWALPFSAFLGAIMAVLIVLAVWRSSRGRSIATLLLLGIGINSLLSALINIMVASSSSDQELRSIVFWLQGGLEARTWEHLQMISMPILIGSLVMAAFGRHLNMMLLGDDLAASTGVHIRLIRYLLLALASVMTGAAVAVSGIIGFVGLVVPHIIRLLAGPDHRLLLPASALGEQFSLCSPMWSREWCFSLLPCRLGSLAPASEHLSLSVSLFVHAGEGKRHEHASCQPPLLQHRQP